MITFLRFSAVVVFFLFGRASAIAEEALRVLAFSSCLDQDRPQPIWEAILREKPEVFIFLGDNVYAATEDMDQMRAQYRKLAEQPGYLKLRSEAMILAVWDDNDYGLKDGGSDYPKKRESKEIFLDFFGVPRGSARWRREGNYDALVLGPAGKRVQVILLDTRTFRGRLRTNDSAVASRRGPYLAHRGELLPFLGEEQWRWLAKELQISVQLRLIVSSVQVLPDEHGWETWGNFPAEREKLFRLLREHSGPLTVLLSGDRHHAELSKIEGVLADPLYELTAGPMNLNKPRGAEPNRFRVGGQYLYENFGLLRIDWTGPAAPRVKFEIRDIKGESKLVYEMEKY